jgi:hypothetical protein
MASFLSVIVQLRQALRTEAQHEDVHLYLYIQVFSKKMIGLLPRSVNFVF